MLHFFSVNWCSRQLLPTPCNKIMKYLFSQKKISPCPLWWCIWRCSCSCKGPTPFFLFEPGTAKEYYTGCFFRGVPVKRNTRYVESKKVKILARLLDSPNLTFLLVKLLLPLLFTQQSPKQPSLKNSQMLKCSSFQLNQMTKMREGVWLNSFSFWTFTNIIKKQLETTSNISHNDKLIKIFPQEP